MRACTRAALDEGVDIRAIKRFAIEASRQGAHERGSDCGVEVAVVGAGPAGLAAAHRARQLGARVVVFESGKNAGGQLVNAVAPLVLREASVAADVAALVEQGVEMRTGVRLGADLPWMALESQYDAVIVATGAGRGINPIREGSALATDVFNFCRRDGIDKRRMDGEVVIEGGGPPAIQAARIALRQGATRVTVVHPQGLEQWPCGPLALCVARAEGVQLLPAARIVSLVGSACLEAVSVRPTKERGRDAVGRARLMTLGKAESLPARVFVSTVDRRPLEENLPEEKMCARGPLGSLRADGQGRLSRPKWYAAGEAMTSAATVVDSMATGRRAAAAAVEDALAAKAGAR
jgi:NADPH-dependent glutamate synthase beta subunit-like oxidoreductase